jgi:hypothetical protein
LLVRSFAAEIAKGEILEGRLDPPRGWISPHYGQRYPAPLLVYTAVAKLPLRITTLLWPTLYTDDPAPLVRLLEGHGRGPHGLLLESTGQSIMFHDPLFVVEPR